jgi:hypothetical protein
MTKVDISPLDARMRKLEWMRELVTDPEMVQLFLQMVSSNGRKPSEPVKTQAKSSVGKRVRTERGELMDTAKKVADGFPGKFSARDLLTQIKTWGYAFSAKREDVAIAAVISRMVKRGILKRSGSRGSQRYEVIRQTSSAV